MNKTTLGLGLLLAILLAAALGPLLILFAVNTLFKAGLAYSFVNWFSVLVLKAITVGALRQVGKG